MVQRLVLLVLAATTASASFAESANLNTPQFSMNTEIAAASLETLAALHFMRTAFPRLKPADKVAELRSQQITAEIRQISSKLEPQVNPEVARLNAQILEQRMEAAKFAGVVKAYQDVPKYDGGGWTEGGAIAGKTTAEAKLVILQERLSEIIAEPKNILPPEEVSKLQARQETLLTENAGLMEQLNKARSTQRFKFWRFCVGATLISDVTHATIAWAAYDNGDFDLIALDNLAPLVNIAKQKLNNQPTSPQERQ